ncbi:putative oxalate/formate antiporter [Macrophomina phaseolina]|uniref:Oxalate/formate antiporter n=1 Tax=Macrophomina phaseolina TaxID=35725 RepID=A0ABQ8GSU0_9PEZI|nr:putative oxalate/formate antiporter [Macrophomina phaseolina]
MSDIEDGQHSPLTSRWADETTPLLSTAQVPNHDEHVVTQQLHAEPDDFPEGGLRAWSVVFGSWCAMVAAFGMLNSMGVIHAWLSSHQLADHSYASIGWIFSIYTFLVYFGSVQIGPVFDAYGLKYTLIPGCVGLVVSVFLFSVCQEYWQYMLDWGILGGISCCLIFTPAIVSVGHWFMQRRALATSLALTAGGIGGTVFPVIILHLEKRIGFDRSLQIIGIICTVLCLIGVATIRTRLPQNKKAGATIDILALRERVYAITTLAIFFLELALFIPVTYLPSYALHQGFQHDFAFHLLVFLNAASVVGRGLAGWLADACGRFRVMVLTSAACTLVSLLWLGADGDRARVVAYAVAFGFSSGSIIGVTPVCVAQICRTEDYGKRYGTTYFIVSFGTLVGIPIAGAILETGHGSAPNYDGLITFSGAVFGAGLVCFVVAYGLAVRWNFRVKF